VSRTDTSAEAPKHPLTGDVEAFNSVTNQWEPAYVQKYAPYRGTHGYYVGWKLATEQWDSHSAWVYQIRAAIARAEGRAS
jgi:hypothetical protein